MPPLHPVRSRDVLVAFVIAFAMYLATVAPGAWWGDSASLASHLETTPKPFARSYWLFKGVARAISAFGFGPALGANIASALFGAGGVALASALAQRLSGSRVGGAAAAGALAVSHTWWSNAVVAEVYTLHVVFELALVHLALGAPRRPWEGLVLGLVAGLALNHHRMILYTLVAVGIWIVVAPAREDRPGVVGRLAAGFGVGALPFLALCFLHPPSSLPIEAGAWGLWLDRALLGGRWSASQMSEHPGRPLLGNLSYLARWTVLNFPSPMLVLAPMGLLALRRRGLLLLGLALGLAALGAARMDWTGDQQVYLLGVHPLLAVLGGVALAKVGSERSRHAIAAAVVALPLLTYGLLAFGDAGRALMPTASTLERSAALWPPKSGRDLPERWCRARLEQLPPDAILVSQWAEGTVFEYLMTTEGLRPDVALLFHRRGPIDLTPSGRPIFVTWDPRAQEPPAAVWETGLILTGSEPGFRRVP